ncbi:MAG: thermonuclease family protein [Chloroflexi bacterium]|jgi:micrococcal nuclease|nr:thermonuclease family protein [Chloroflexota bacterium]
MGRRWRLALAAVLATLLLGCRLPTAAETAAPPAGAVEARVVRVVDGDTIIVAIGGRQQRVRYIGVNAPESVDPRREVQCFGREAAARNAQLVDGQRVWLEKDVSETDPYGRLLRYVYVNGTMVNAELVREGYARAVTFPPDVRYAEELRRLEREAREARRGLWGTCPPPGR